LTKSFDAIIIGAGVQGTSTAYHLTKAGFGRTLILDELEAAGRGSSGRSGSMLMKSRENRAKVEFSLYSYSWLFAFPEHFGEQLSFSKTGFLSLVPTSLRDRYLEEHQLRLDAGAPSRLLDQREIASIAPAVDTSGIEFGLLGPDDGVIDPDQLIRSYLRGAQAAGASLRLRTRVVGLDTSSSNGVRVDTTRGQFEAPIVINAAGAGAAAIGKFVGVELPIQSLRRSLYFVSAPDTRLQTGPMVEESGVEWYFRGLGGDRVLVGMGLESDGGSSDAADLSFWETVKATAARRVPALQHAVIVGGTSGLRPLTPDILPIIGPAPGAAGFYNNCGWGGEGIMHSPAGGRMTVDSITRTSTAGLDWRVCQVERFSTQSVTEKSHQLKGEIA
jgi:glycine/D-amino acid oxidase-like deaminating enzyme